MATSKRMSQPARSTSKCIPCYGGNNLKPGQDTPETTITKYLINCIKDHFGRRPQFSLFFPYFNVFV